MRRLEGEWVGEGQGRGRVEAVRGERWLHECGQWHAFIQDVWKREQEGKKEGEGDNESAFEVGKRWEM
jgi:hypothetical protein